MKWNILSKTPKGTEAKMRSEEIIKILLKNRGLKTKKEIEEFLNPKNPANFTARDLGIDEKEVKKAVKRVGEAIKNGEAMVVYGDYDADGICATAILWEKLYQLTKNVLPYIPERVSEGYGLNRDSISKLKTQNPKLRLLITVDHGITANEKIQFAKELGVDVIVCDHHQLGREKPDCIAVVHTEEVCAAAIAWFLSNKIQETKSGRQPITNPQSPVTNHQSLVTSHQSPITNHLDLVAIATIADLEPLIGVNRSFAKYGLQALRKTKRCGLQSIFKEAGINQEEIGTYEVGFIIAPRLNAMGRMEHALESLRLLCTKDYARADSLAAKLGLTNKERQLLTEETVKQARLLVAGIEGELPKFLVVDSDQYEEGIIGLVAGKLVEEFHRPAVVIAKGKIYSKASARSINGFNIIEAIRMHQGLLLDAGGHPMAAGFTIETTKIEEFKKRLTQTAEEQISSELLEKTLKIDLELPMEEIPLELYDKIQAITPFGLGNPEPVFCTKAIVKDFRLVGTEGKHLKLTLAAATNHQSPVTNRYPAIAFNQGKLAEQLKIDQEVEIAYTIGLNKWNNQENLDLKIKDLKIAN